MNSLNEAVYIDANSLYGVNDLPDRLPDIEAINNYIYNLINCAPGQRARTFQPTFGSLWLQFVHEPISDITSQKMQIFMIKALEEWLPMIQIDRSNTGIQPVQELPGYAVQIAFQMPNVANTQYVNFNVEQ